MLKKSRVTHFGPGDRAVIREGFTEQVTLGLGLRVCVGVQRQASEGTLQAELHAALSWARWMVWFHFAQGEQVWGRWSSLPCVREARPPPDSSSGVLPTAHLPPRSTLQASVPF